MKNKFKIFIMFLLITMLVSASSCKKDISLKEAFDNLNESSFTVHETSKVVISTTINGKTSKSTTYPSSYMFFEDGKMYCETNSNTIYYETQGDFIKSYFKENDTWKVLGVEEKNDYNSLDTVFDEEILNYFEKNNNVYIGDCEKINDLSADYFNYLSEKLLGIKEFELNEFAFKKYNIILSNNSVRAYEYIFTISATYNSIIIDIEMEVFSDITEIGTTTVETPSGLPIE